MRILWFTNTPSLYKKNDNGYNGGGWIESLEKMVSSIDNIELGVSFFHNDNDFRVKRNKTTYYPVPLYNSKLKKLKHWLFYNRYNDIEVQYYLKVIADFKPDIIHIFGTERSYGLLNKEIEIPIVIHIQGLLNPTLNAYFAPGVNSNDIYLNNIFHPIKMYRELRIFSFFQHHVYTETEILRYSNYLMGRTKWDKEVSTLYAKNAIYYYCSEVLRDLFYNVEPWKYKERERLILVSTISKTTYKGFDLILKTAKLLKDLGNIDFCWDVFGISDYREWENNLNINCSEVNVQLFGVAESESLVTAIQNADIFIHPSYIDNSPNSVCEAQIIGIPVIATNVGGIPSLIEDGITGYLIPANDPFTLVAKIVELNHNPDLMIETGRNARKCALKRHNKETILSDLFAIYNDIYEKSTTAIV